MSFESAFQGLENTLLDIRDRLERMEQKFDDLNKQMEGDVQFAAKILHVKPGTIYQLTYKDVIPHHKYGKRLIFYRDELEQWRLAGRPDNWRALFPEQQ